MKTLVTIIIAALFLTACNSDQLTKKKKELEALKSGLTSTKEKIKKLEEEIALLDTAPKADKISEVNTMALTNSIFKTYIEVQGRVDADENVSLSTQMGGMITKINVQVGQAVNKGQVLAETDASAIYQQISDLQTNLDLSKQVFQKQQNLWNQKIGTEIQYLQAKTTKESLEKKLSLLQEQLRMSRIISPINGTVDAVNIKLSQSVMPGMNAINVVNFSNLKVKADVAESYAQRVKTGNTVLIYFPDIDDSLTAKVNYASRAINPLSRTFGVEVLLANNKSYHPNMVAKIKINDYQSAKPEMIVPIRYIQKNNDESFVLVEENGVAVKKIITFGKEYNGYAQITSGLVEGDKLITEGYDIINEGDKIVVKK
ncbi:MAG: efflux RND transporter periplasmic adaptor subunit [bacterium]|nr:efflux RND transporter periplasmic adaptor subunit [bacterium]